MCMGTINILLIIKIIVNSEIFITHISEYRLSQHDEIHESNLNDEKKSFINEMKKQSFIKEIRSVFQVII